jgi:hypothetical protein
VHRLKQRRFPPFIEELEHFLAEGKSTALLGSLAKGPLRLIGQAPLNAELALASLAAPVEGLQRQLAVFEQQRDEATQKGAISLSC